MKLKSEFSSQQKVNHAEEAVGAGIKATNRFSEELEMGL